MSIADLGKEWVASQTHLKPRSFAVFEVAGRVDDEAASGQRVRSDIRHSEVQRWCARCRVAEATVVIRACGILVGMMDVAVRHRRLPSNPARGVNLPLKGSKLRHHPTRPQVQFMAHGSRLVGTLVLRLGDTALRGGEAVGLRVRSIDMTRRRVFTRVNTVNARGVVVASTPKNQEARSVPLPEFLRSLLEERCAGETRDDPIFGDGARYLRTPTRREWFAGSRSRAAADVAFPPSLTRNDRRHTAASLAFSTCVKEMALLRMPGHTSNAVTLDICADLCADALDAIAFAINQKKSVSAGPTGALPAHVRAAQGFSKSVNQTKMRNCSFFISAKIGRAH